MTEAAPLPLFAVPSPETCVYRLSPRPKRTFHTILDALELFPPPGVFHTRVTSALEGYAFTLRTEHELRGAKLLEVLTCRVDGGLVADAFTRTMHLHDGREARREEVRFGLGPVALPRDLFPEVCLPFLLRGQPFDKARRSVHAWISDRFVARVYYEARRTRAVEVPAGRFECWEVEMYPDLNDWVKMPRVLAELSKPFLPKYHMHYELRPPHRLVHFEGPLGPPGAPEVVLELLRGG
jgi:hypothetical protein